MVSDFSLPHTRRASSKATHSSGGTHAEPKGTVGRVVGSLDPVSVHKREKENRECTWAAVREISSAQAWHVGDPSFSQGAVSLDIREAS